jgi:hypothetical protein
VDIRVIRKESYGTVRFYPDCTKSKILAALMSKKTFHYYELSLIKDLGFTVVAELPHEQEVTL